MEQSPAQVRLEADGYPLVVPSCVALVFGIGGLFLDDQLHPVIWLLITSVGAMGLLNAALWSTQLRPDRLVSGGIRKQVAMKSALHSATVMEGNELVPWKSVVLNFEDGTVEKVLGSGDHIDHELWASKINTWLTS